jgi:hypothetical protein
LRINNEKEVNEIEDDSEICLAWSWEGVTEHESMEASLSDYDIHKVLLANQSFEPLASNAFVTNSGFLGICVDTGATSSVGGRKQYEAYLKSIIVPRSARVLGKSSKRFKFGSTSVESVGVAVIRIRYSSIEDSGSDQPMSFAFEMDIVDIDVPLLIGLDVLRGSDATVDISAKVMRTCSCQYPIEFSHGHIFVPRKHGVVLFSATALTSLLRKLTHPSCRVPSCENSACTGIADHAIESKM